MEKVGRPYNPIKTYKTLDQGRARRIADEYERMAHDPHNPVVRSAYEAMIVETIAQYQFIKSLRVKIDVMRPGEYPYTASPRLAILDLVENKHFWLYPSSSGLGPDDSYNRDDLLLALTDEYIGDMQLCANDVFRIVHDFFGHAKEGGGFRAEGEENAWRCHACMYSRLCLGRGTSGL